MTIKELKEKLEILIEDGKEDYILIFDGLVVSVVYRFYIDNERKEVWL